MQARKFNIPSTFLFPLIIIFVLAVASPIPAFAEDALEALMKKYGNSKTKDAATAPQEITTAQTTQADSNSKVASNTKPEDTKVDSGAKSDIAASAESVKATKTEPAKTRELTEAKTAVKSEPIKMAENKATALGSDKLVAQNQPAPKVVPAATPAATSATSSVANSFTIQLGSFGSEAEAKNKVAELKTKNLDAFYSKGRVLDADWYRVNVGQFNSRQEALKYHGANKSQLTAGSFVTRINKDNVIVQDAPVLAVAVAAPMAATPDVSAPATPSVPAPSAEKTSADPASNPADTDATNSLLGARGEKFKNFLASKGASFELVYKLDYVSNFDGGIDRDTGLLGNVDIKSTIDLEKLSRVPGLKLNLYGLGDHGDDPSDFIGDSFVTSNIEAPNTFKLYEAYFDSVVDGKVNISLGLRDLNAVYYVTDSSGLFINSAFGMTPSFAQNSPSIFPKTAMALNFHYMGESSIYFKMGAFNAIAGDPDNDYGTRADIDLPFFAGTDDGYLMVWETGLDRSSKDTSGAAKYSLGAWVYTDPAERFDGNGTDKNWGYYFLLNKDITHKLSVFARYSRAEESVNAFTQSMETGVTYKGLIPKRKEDQMGFGIATALASSDYQEASSTRYQETAFELYYQIDLGRGITLRPDYQYISNPGLSKTLDDAQVFTTRATIVF